jgi:alkanesulfonate monooxygenase SsuD/methylene tetrahydromethanopterin reductase-like flavin-dependent oxidoreductase (luciferase family)
MTGCVFGLSAEEVEHKVALRTNHQRTAAELIQRGMIVGTGAEIVEQCRAYAEAGVQRIMLQWLDLDDISGLEALAQALLPNF